MYHTNEKYNMPIK